jgi:hypothetical protein
MTCCFTNILMDLLVKESFQDFAKFAQIHFNAEPGTSPFSMKTNLQNWNFSEILDFENFEFQVGKTPFSDLKVLCALKR